MARKLTLVLSAAMLLLLAAATVVEATTDVEQAYRQIYGTTWFALLWAVLAVVATAYYLKKGPRKPLATPLLHLSFVVILAGAAITHFFGKEGTLHLRQGQTATTFADKATGKQLPLPYSVKLDSFQIVFMPGTMSPADFVSHISCRNSSETNTARVSMNVIYNNSNYRFVQKSFDPDRRGTVLAVAYDPWGIGITYFGYIILAISAVLMLLGKRGRFRQLLTQFYALAGKGCCLILLATMAAPACSMAENASVPSVNRQKADRMARMQVVYNNRTAPLNTLATDFLLKVYGKRTYKGLSAEQVLVGWTLRPDEWKKQKMILIKDGALRKRLGVEGRYASLQQLFDGEEYRLMPLLDEANSTDGTQGTHAKDAPPVSMKALQQTDERVGLLLLAAENSLVVPAGSGAKKLSHAEVEAEIFYNSLPMTTILFMLNLTAGILLFIIAVLKGARARTVLPVGLLAASCLCMTAYYGLRWYVAGRIPLGNGYETMLFLALAIMAFALLAYRMVRQIGRIVVAFGLLLSGFTLLVAHLGQMNPQITPLMPVLQSPILSSHVSIIMMAYALLALMMLNGCYVLWLLHSAGKGAVTNEKRHHIELLTILNRIMLYPAVMFLAVGIFLGAVWANISWGKYWSWDPKETWALITFIVYGAAFHEHTLKWTRSEKWFNLYLVLAFLSVLMTYFGVNYLLGGMHSYA